MWLLESRRAQNTKFMLGITLAQLFNVPRTCQSEGNWRMPWRSFQFVGGQRWKSEKCEWTETNLCGRRRSRWQAKKITHSVPLVFAKGMIEKKCPIAWLPFRSLVLSQLEQCQDISGRLSDSDVQLKMKRKKSMHYFLCRSFVQHASEWFLTFWRLDWAFIVICRRRHS